MAILQCRKCGANINSDARSTQCKKCGALFPFACAVCDRQLRAPFPVYEDERFLTLDDEPLCSEHFLRKCPDCDAWFRADENPGFFRCPACAAAAKQGPSFTAPLEEYDQEEYEDDSEEAPVKRQDARGPNPNAVVLMGAGAAFLALLGWFLFGPK